MSTGLEVIKWLCFLTVAFVMQDFFKIYWNMFRVVMKVKELLIMNMKKMIWPTKMMFLCPRKRNLICPKKQTMICPSITEFCWQLIANYGLTKTAKSVSQHYRILLATHCRLWTYQQLYTRTFSVTLFGKLTTNRFTDHWQREPYGKNPTKSTLENYNEP